VARPQKKGAISAVKHHDKGVLVLVVVTQPPPHEYLIGGAAPIVTTEHLIVIAHRFKVGVMEQLIGVVVVEAANRDGVTWTQERPQ
jgi:hypothetical protein